MYFLKNVLFLFAILWAGTFSVFGQSSWSINASLQYARGNYLSSETLNSWYLYGGIRYEHNDLSAALSIPFIASNGQNISQIGNIYIPNHMGSGSQSMGGMGSGGHGGNVMGGSSLTSTSASENYGIGDLYFFTNYNLLNQFTSPLGISLGGFIKFPTASTANGFGTGKFDFSLSGTLRKAIGSFLVYGSVGYIFIGDPDSIDYNDPVTFNAGIGKSFAEGNFSLLLSYSIYSKLLDIYEKPQQLSLGANIKSGDKINYTLIGSAGLSNSTPDFAFSVGLRYNLGN